METAFFSQSRLEKMISNFLAIFAFLIFLGKTLAFDTGQILLLSFDGFAFDYIKKLESNLTNFRRVSREGVKTSDGVFPPFVTNTFPSHYSTVTGLYVESHGVVGNYFYDPSLNESFSYRAQDFDPKWWNGGEPIWVTARRHGLKSATYFWVGSEIEIRGWRPNHYKMYDPRVPFEDRVDQGLKWLDEGIDVVCIYFNEPDFTGHMYGPDSPEVVEAVFKMDKLLGRILDGLEAKGLDSSVNLLLTSDHGMVDIWPNQTISLRDYIDMSQIRVVFWGPTTMIRSLRPEDTLKVFQRLKTAHPRMKVFMKNDIPERWRYRDNERIMDILAVADESWYIVDEDKGFPTDKDSGRPKKGTHGYDNALSSMRAIFFAKGPGIASGKVVPSFDSVNYYSLMCRLLGIPAAPNNGTVEVVRNILKDDSSAGSSANGKSLSAVILTCVGLLFLLLNQFF